MRVYADSGQFIAVLNGSERYSLESQSILKAAENGVIALYTSFLSMAEVIKTRRQLLSRSADEERIISELMDQPFVNYVSLEMVVATNARYLWDRNCQPRDSIHVASAIAAKCERMYAIDGGLVALSGFANGRLKVPEIRHPESLTDPELPL